MPVGCTDTLSTVISKGLVFINALIKWFWQWLKTSPSVLRQT